MHTHTHTRISAHKAHTSCQFTAQKASPTFQHRLRCFPLLVSRMRKIMQSGKPWNQELKVLSPWQDWNIEEVLLDALVGVSAFKVSWLSASVWV